jgi:hypothetical protein
MERGKGCVVDIDMEGVCDVEVCAVGNVMDVIYMAWRKGRHMYWRYIYM